jgi:NADH-quinone oxidoreductase subunit N
MTVGAFMFLGYAGRPASGGQPAKEAETYEDLAGLAKRRPVAAALMTVFMVSLAGLPPTAGFLGKFMLLKAAIDAKYVGLAVLAVVASLVSVVYYLKVVVAMYMKEAPEGAAAEAPERPDFNVGMAVVIAAVLTLALGIYPVYYLNFARQAVAMLVGSPDGP